MSMHLICGGSLALPVQLRPGARGGACLIAFQCLAGHTDETLAVVRGRGESQQPDRWDLTCAPWGGHAYFLSDAWGLTDEPLLPPQLRTLALSSSQF